MATQVPPPVNRSHARAFLAALVAMALPTGAEAASWVRVGGNDSVTVFVDHESLRRTGTKVRSWLKWEWVRPVAIPNVYPLTYYQLERQLQISDCQTKTLAIAQGIRYAEGNGGDVVDSYSFEEKHLRYEEAAPETIGESIIGFVCKSAGPKRK